MRSLEEKAQSVIDWIEEETDVNCADYEGIKGQIEAVLDEHGRDEALDAVASL